MQMNAATPLTNDEIVKLAPAAGAITPHADVSSKYSFVPTIQAVDLIRSVGWLPVSARQAGVRKDDRRGFQKHIIRFMQPGFSTQEERVDMILTNSHDRGCAFKLAVSIWRKICGNGLMVACKIFEFSHRHINFDRQAFIESAYLIADGSTQISNQVRDLKTVELNPNERGVFALAAASLVYDDVKEAPIKPTQLLTERRYDDQGKDLWTTFNVVQENIMKGGLRGEKRGDNGRIKKVRTRPVKSIDRDIRLNKALWVLTEEMARIKS